MGIFLDDQNKSLDNMKNIEFGDSIKIGDNVYISKQDFFKMVIRGIVPYSRIRVSDINFRPYMSSGIRDYLIALFCKEHVIPIHYLKELGDRIEDKESLFSNYYKDVLKIRNVIIKYCDLYGVTEISYKQLVNLFYEETMFKSLGNVSFCISLLHYVIGKEYCDTFISLFDVVKKYNLLFNERIDYYSLIKNQNCNELQLSARTQDILFSRNRLSADDYGDSDYINVDNLYVVSPKIFFSFEDVSKVILSLFEQNTLRQYTIYEVYDYLCEFFNVESFNMFNLIAFLGENKTVGIKQAQSVFLKYVIYNNKDFLSFKNRTERIIGVREKLLKCIDVLGFDFVKNIAQRTKPIFLFDYEGGEKAPISISESMKIGKDAISVFLNNVSSEEASLLLENADEFENFIHLLVLNKEKENCVIKLKKTITFLLRYVDVKNYNLRLKYLLPKDCVDILISSQIEMIKDLSNIDLEICELILQYQRDIIELLQDLTVSVFCKLNNEFKIFLQLRKNGAEAHKFWGDYLKILNSRAKGATLENAGAPAGITRERVRQIEKLYFKSFIDFYKRTRNLIFSLIKSEQFLLDSEIVDCFEQNATIFKYLLVNSYLDDYVYIDEIKKIAFSEHIEWYKDLVLYRDSLPQLIDCSNCQSVIDEAKKLVSNKVNLTDQEYKKILFNNYRLIGNQYSTVNLTKSQKFVNILKRFFPGIIRVYDKQFLSDFRKKYVEVYGKDDLDSDRAISGILTGVCVLAGRGEYIYADNKMFLSEEISNKIYDYMIGSGKTTFLSNNLYALFEDDLKKEGINNKYFLHGALRQRFEGKFFFKKDYISTSEKIPPFYKEIFEYVKNSNSFVSFEEIQNKFIGVPWGIINFAVSQEGILNYRSKYIHIDLLNINNRDVNYLRNVLISSLSDNRIHHISDLMTYIKLTNKELTIKLMLEDSFGLFSVLEYLFGEEFEFKRPFIANVGIRIDNQYDRLCEFVNSFENLSIDSLVDFANENRLHMYSIIEFVDGLENFVFKNNESIVKIEKTNLNKYNVEIVEGIITKIMGDNEFIFADKLNILGVLPKEVEWTPWLIYSALNKFGKNLKGIPSDTKFKNKNVYIARPVIIKREVSAKNLNEYIDYLRQKMNLNDVDFYKYLRSKGLA